MHFRLSFLFCCHLLIASCTTLSEGYKLGEELYKGSVFTPSSQSMRSSAWVLSRETKFYIARNSELTVLNSENSAALTDALHRAIRENFPNAKVGLLAESNEQAQTTADRIGADFVVYPSIIMWDDKVGDWTEIYRTFKNDNNATVRKKFGLDDARVQIIIRHVVTGSLFDVVQVEASSGLITLYGDRPETVIFPALRSFFASLVAVSS